jgi:hypothetical protein
MLPVAGYNKPVREKMSIIDKIKNIGNKVVNVLY